ncbi:MAG TPA: hypothetical protein VGB97_02545 [Candidatus Paceibacterota bacterium]|jgi:hypothetical protein
MAEQLVGIEIDSGTDNGTTDGAQLEEILVPVSAAPVTDKPAPKPKKARAKKSSDQPSTKVKKALPAQVEAAKPVAVAKSVEAKKPADKPERHAVANRIRWEGPVSFTPGQGVAQVAEELYIAPLIMRKGIGIGIEILSSKPVEADKPLKGYLTLVETKFSDNTTYLVGHLTANENKAARFHLRSRGDPKAKPHTRRVARINLPVARYGFVEVMEL